MYYHLVTVNNHGMIENYCYYHLKALTSRNLENQVRWSKKWSNNPFFAQHSKYFFRNLPCMIIGIEPKKDSEEPWYNNKLLISSYNAFHLCKHFFET